MSECIRSLWCLSPYHYPPSWWCVVFSFKCNSTDSQWIVNTYVPWRTTKHTKKCGLMEEEAATQNWGGRPGCEHAWSSSSVHLSTGWSSLLLCGICLIHFAHFSRINLRFIPSVHSHLLLFFLCWYNHRPYTQSAHDTLIIAHLS